MNPGDRLKLLKEDLAGTGSMDSDSLAEVIRKKLKPLKKGRKRKNGN